MCLDDLFKAVETRHHIEMVHVSLTTASVDIQQHADIIENDDDEDNDWSTIASEEDDEEEEPEVPPCDCHEATAQPIFALPEGIVLGECSICYDEIKMINMTVTRCGHVFHASCAFAALERRMDCPLCRTQLVNEVLEEDE
jgi:hypothetical protein